MGVLRHFSFTQSIDFKVPNSSFCDRGSVSTGRGWLTGRELINPDSYQHTEILAGQALREAAEGQYPTLNALRLILALSIGIMKEGKDQRTGDRNPASHFCSKRRGDNSLAGLLWDCSNFEGTQ